NWPRPTSPTDIRSFLGLVGYYRRFVEGFSFISSPLIKLTHKSVKFQWSEACEKIFQELKKRLNTSPVLTLPEGTQGFVVYCDALRVGCRSICFENMVSLPLLSIYILPYFSFKICQILKKNGDFTFFFIVVALLCGKKSLPHVPSKVCYQLLR
ncbi:hypothetical protein MTR67_001113, partial [Solanum verrucosum]